ncbi:YbbR-like domain-containing protein [Antarcticibacterium arcticum]|uniref:YbbR-like domain-containing protein n=1 Tax=Antarcticibacterium arcticum TaxID=2585771 RepID=A0A5B8YP42_9FLAO|nr:YbbR-like domain-containing protein [Antarcticibacterium arcticum]
MSKKKKQGKPWIKRGPLKTFLFFLGFSTVIWIFVQFAKQYTVPVELPLTYINVPKDKLLVDQNPASLNLRVKDYGFNIARFKMFPPALRIDVSDSREDNRQLVYDLEQQKPALLAQLNLDFENVTFLQNNLRINFEQKAVKTVSIVPNIELGFAVGYSALEEVKLQPDTMRVSGPQSILDTLEEVRTVQLKINNISNDLQGSIKLDKGGLEKVTFFQEEVNYSLRTDKFTEGRIEIPIELQNVPKGYNVVIFPKEVAVFYQVSLNDFEKIKSTAFKVVVDFRNELPKEGFLLAQVIQKPSLVNNVRLNEKKIQFVVKR